MHINRSTLSSLAFLAVLLPVSAHSQSTVESFSNSQDDIDNIIVTASRSPLARVGVGSSVSVITREQIERRQARYVTDLLRAEPGFAVSRSGGNGSQTQVRVRGAEANHVLVLIDGVRANDPASGDEFRWEFLSTSNIERIEIVRGPQSSLWGSDAVSAVVHVITRRGAGPRGFDAYAETGSHETLNGGIGGSAGGGRWSLDGGLERQDTGGFNVSRTGNENDASDLFSATLNGRLQATDALALTMGIRAVDAFSQFDPVDFATGLPGDADAATDASQFYGQAGASFQRADSRITHHLNVRMLDTDNDSLTGGVTTATSSAERLTFAYQADFGIADNLLSLAIEHEQTEFHQRGAVNFGDPNPNQDQEMDASSVIADFQGRMLERMSWLLSARYDSNSDFDDAVTGRLAVAFELTPDTHLRASVGTGQKNPTFTERFGFFPDQFVGNPDLQPETSVSVDVGIEQSLLQDALQLQLTVFHQDLENEIDGFVFDAASGSFTADNRDGSSSRIGVEVGASFNVGENMTLRGSYTYTDATEEDVTGNDARELRRPEHAASVSADWRFLDERANLLLVADFGGSRDDIFFPPFPEPSEIVTMQSYWLLDLTLGFDLTDRVNVFARATNLLDEDYEEVYGYRTDGRAAYVGVRLGLGD